MPDPKKHHYVPKVLLKHFTTGTKDTHIWAFDIAKLTRFHPNIKDAAAQSNYYRVTNDHDPDLDPLVLEKLFGSEIESPAGPVLQQLIATSKIPKHKIPQEIATLMAASMARVPRTIDGLNELNSRLLRRVLWYYAHDPRRASQMADHAPSLDTSTLQKLLEHDALEISLERNFILQQAMIGFPNALQAIQSRNWCLATSDTDDHFILSDCPFVVSWSKPTPGPYPPALGLSNTTATFPISPKHVLIGTFEPLPANLVAPPEDVANINARTASYATRFLFAHEDDFRIELPNREIGNWERYKSFLQSRRTQED